MPYLRFSGMEYEKNYFHIWIHYPPICLIPKFKRNQRTKKFLGQKIHYLGILELEISKLILIFESNSLEFGHFLNFAKRNKKCLNFRPKIPYLSFSGLESENAIVIVEMVTLEFV